MSLITYEDLKAKYEQKLLKEQEVLCRLLAKLKDGYLVEINDEWEGVVPKSHITNLTEIESSVTEPIKALIISGPDKNDRYMVSPKVLKEKAIWEMLEKYKQESQPLRVRISKVVKGGAEIFIDTLRAFLPGRYLRLPGVSPENWINQEIDVLIEELDFKDKKIILNQKKAIEHERQRKAESLIHSLKEGDIVEVPVLRIADFGVFVDLGGIDGLVPASELSWGRFNHPKDVVSVGQMIKVRIFRIERDSLRIACSVKQLEGDPWEHVEEQIGIGSLVEGKVVNEAPFGFFIELKPGVEALLHNSEMDSVAEKPKVGSNITARIIKIDSDQRKIGLSLKDISQDSEKQEQNVNEPALPVENKTVTSEYTMNGNGNGNNYSLPDSGSQTVITGPGIALNPGQDSLENNN